MAKQHLESIFRKSLNQYKERLWYIKLQVSIFAHCISPGDYLILSHYRRYLIECKEIRIDRQRFTFDALSQKESLLEFERKHTNNMSYLLLMFWNHGIKKSSIFMIPILEWCEFEENHGKKSATFVEIEERFSHQKLEVLKGGLLNLGNILV